MMAMETEIEIYRALRESQNSYIYFILGTAGAAIAFAVSQTRDASLSWFQLPLAAAVLCWGISFLLGCRNRLHYSAALQTNAALSRAQAGREPLIGDHTQAIAEGSEILRTIFKDHSDKAKQYANWQFRFLIVGAVLYVAWHVIEMYLRTA